MATHRIRLGGFMSSLAISQKWHDQVAPCLSHLENQGCEVLAVHINETKVSVHIEHDKAARSLPNSGCMIKGKTTLGKVEVGQCNVWWAIYP